MENVFTTEGKITATIKLSTMEMTGSRLPSINITSGISKLGQHLYIIQATYPHSSSTIEKGIFIQWHVNFKSMHQEKPLILLRDTLSLITGTAMTKDVRNIKRRVNQLIETQTQQQGTLVHIISILNIQI